MTLKALKNLLEVEKEASTLIFNAQNEKEKLIAKAEKESLKYEEKKLKALEKDIEVLKEKTDEKLIALEEEYKIKLTDIKKSLNKNIDKRLDEAFKYLLEVMFE